MTSFSTGSPSSTTSTSGVASYAQPYAQQNLANVYGLTQQAYQPYQGQQNAALTGLQNQSYDAGQNLGVNQNSINAGNAAQTSINNLQNTSYNPNQLNYSNIQAPQLNSYMMNTPITQAAQFQGPQNVGYQGVGTQGFNNRSAAQLMNPYLQQSLAPQLALLNQQQGMQATQNAGQATQAGAFGGSRFGIQNALQNQSNQLATSNLVGNAYNTAYNNAQNQFNTQQALGLQAQQSNQQAGVTTGLANQNMAYNTGLQNAQLQQQSNLANQQAGLTAGQANLGAQLSTQQLGAQQNLTAQQANQANQLQANAQNINQQQFGAGLNLQANQSALQGASTLNNIGNTQFSQGAQAASLQNQLGTQQQAYQQGLLNTQYQNFQNQKNYPYQQASYLQNAINGYPVSNTTSTTQPSTPSYLQQIGAVGAGLYGLNTLSNGAVSTGASNAWNYITGGKKGGLPKDFEVTKMKAGGSTQSSYIKKAISDAESLGDYDIADYLSSVLSGGVDTTNPSTVANSISTKVPQSVAGAQVAASPSAGQQAAGITSANPNLQAPSGLGTQPQQTQRGIAPAAPSAAESSSNPYSMPTMQDLIAMKKEAAQQQAAQTAQANTDAAAANAQSNFRQSEIAQQGQPVASEAAGGLQSIYLSDDMVPSHHANGGITDVARYADAGVTTSDDSLPADIQKADMGDNSLDLGAPSTLNTVRENRGLSAVPIGRVQDVPNQQILQQANAEAQQLRQAQAPQQAPQGYVPPQLPANISDAGIRNQAGAAGYNMLRQAYQDINGQKAPTAEDWQAHQDKIYEHNKKLMGDSPIPDLIRANEESKKHNADIERVQKGLALIASMPDFLEGNQAGRGLTRGVSSAAKGWGSAVMNKDMADAALDKMNATLKVAQRAEQQGQVKLASDANKQFFEEQDKFNKSITESKIKIADAAGKLAAEEKGFRPTINVDNKPSSARNYQDDVDAIKATLKETDKAAGTTHSEAWYESEARTKARGLVSTGMPGNAATNLTSITKEQEAAKAKDIENAKKIFMSPLFRGSKDTKPTFEKYMRENGNDLVKAQAAYANAVANNQIPSNSSNTGTSSSPNVTTTIPNPTAMKLLPMPPSADKAVKGALYDTAKGPAIWDGTQFNVYNGSIEK